MRIFKDNRAIGKRATDNLYFQYTVVFCIYVLGIFAALIIAHRSFMQFHDAYKQSAFRLIEIQNQFRSIMSGDGFSYWSWYEGMGIDEPLEIFVDPFSFIGSLFPTRYLELGLTFAALLRMYFGGIAFLLLGKEVNLKKEQNLIGAILYVFSACFIGLALRQSESLFNAYLFPLLVLGVERIYKGKRPVLFILCVSYYMLISVYRAYMSALIVILYILLRYFAYNEVLVIKEYLASIGRFILYGLIGILVSAGSSIFAIFIILRSSTDSSLQGEGLLFDEDFYLDFGKMLLGTGATYDYLDIGLPILIIILMPIAIRNCSRKATNTIMTIILFAMLLIPFFGSMLNGFSYVTFRWSYAFVLFATWTAAEQFDTDVLTQKGTSRLLCTGLIIIGIWTYALYLAGLISLDNAGSKYVAIQLAAGALLLVLIFVMSKKPQNIKALTIAVLFVSLVSLSTGWTFGFHNTIEKFARNASVYNNLNKSTLRVSNQIKDSGFYRVDSVDGVSRQEILMFPSNENIWWKSNNLFIYNSNIPKELTGFNVEMGNSYGYARRVFVLSNENRMGIDFLCGVRYFLGNDAKKEGFESSDNYAAYGFEKVEEIDGVSVFKNKYDVGMGFVLKRAMLKSDFDQLNRVEKEQALMQAAVVPDEEAPRYKDLNWVKAEDLQFDIDNLPFEIANGDGIRFEDGKIVAEKDDASFSLKLRDVKPCQMIISFDNILRDSEDGISSGSYEITASDARLQRNIMHDKSRQGVANIKNHDINMGYVKGDDDVTISLSRKGEYTYDKFYVSAMSVDNYDHFAKECMKNAFTVDSYTDEYVDGHVSADSDGILFLSVPANENWDIFVDGKKADKIEDLDIAFMGTEVSKGDHHIELKYSNPYVKYGNLISLAGLLLIIAVSRGKRGDSSKRSA